MSFKPAFSLWRSKTRYVPVECTYAIHPQKLRAAETGKGSVYRGNTLMDMAQVQFLPERGLLRRPAQNVFVWVSHPTYLSEHYFHVHDYFTRFSQKSMKELSTPVPPPGKRCAFRMDVSSCKKIIDGAPPSGRLGRNRR